MKPIYVNAWCTFFMLMGCNLLAVANESITQVPRSVIAVIGTGEMGSALGIRFSEVGHQVIYGSRDPAAEKVSALVAKTGNGASATNQRNAAQSSDIVVLALPWPAMETVVQNLGDLDGKILVDISMPWRQADDGYPEITLSTSSAEMIQEWNPSAKVVKTFASAGSNLIVDSSAANGPVTMPLASDHIDAKETVAKIAATLGFDPVDFGPLRMARHIESLQVIWLIPVLQDRTTGWEFYFRRSHWPCHWGPTKDWAQPVIDANRLANIPETQRLPEPCP